MKTRSSGKRDFSALEQRRLRAARLLQRGLRPAEVARRVGVHRQSVGRWKAQLEREGVAGLRKAGSAGRPAKLTAAQLLQLEEELVRGPRAWWYSTELWTTPRVADLIQRRFGDRYHRDHVGRVLAKMEWSCQRPGGRAKERNEARISGWRRGAWPRIKKSPEIEGHHRAAGRERPERAPPSGAHLGPTRPDSGAAVPLQLGDPGGDRWDDLREFLLPVVRGVDQGAAGGKVPASPAAAPEREVDFALGPPARSPQPVGTGLSGRAATHRAGVAARLRSRTQPGRVLMGATEGTPPGELLSRPSGRIEARDAQRPPAVAPPAPYRRLLLETKYVALLKVL